MHSQLASAHSDLGQMKSRRQARLPHAASSSSFLRVKVHPGDERETQLPGQSHSESPQSLQASARHSISSSVSSAASEPSS